jgi:hypothetical protein
MVPKRASGGVKVRTADQRAEILGMIARLRESGATERRDRRAPKTKNGQSGRPSRLPGAPQGVSARDFAIALQSLNMRLSRVEQRLEGQPSPAAAAAGAASAKTPADTMFSGILKGQMLSDMLQLVSSNQMSGVFVIESEAGTCRLYFFEGRIRHAVGEDVTGEEAFFAAFASREGRYSFTETQDLPPETTVASGTQYLVLEALRRMDETSGS